MFMDIEEKNNRLIQKYNDHTGQNIKVLRSHVHSNTHSHVHDDANAHLHDEHEHAVTEELKS